MSRYIKLFFLLAIIGSTFWACESNNAQEEKDMRAYEDTLRSVVRNHMLHLVKIVNEIAEEQGIPINQTFEAAVA